MGERRRLLPRSKGLRIPQALSLMTYDQPLANAIEEQLRGLLWEELSEMTLRMTTVGSGMERGRKDVERIRTMYPSITIDIFQK